MHSSGILALLSLLACRTSEKDESDTEATIDIGTGTTNCLDPDTYKKYDAPVDPLHYDIAIFQVKQSNGGDSKHLSETFYIENASLKAIIGGANSGNYNPDGKISYLGREFEAFGDAKIHFTAISVETFSDTVCNSNVKEPTDEEAAALMCRIGSESTIEILGTSDTADTADTGEEALSCSAQEFLDAHLDKLDEKVINVFIVEDLYEGGMSALYTSTEGKKYGVVFLNDYSCLKTLTHELGHLFGLDHPHATGGDGIEDTVDGGFGEYGECELDYFTCEVTCPDGVEKPDPSDLMAYSGDCGTEFTPGQAGAIRCMAQTDETLVDMGKSTPSTSAFPYEGDLTLNCPTESTANNFSTIQEAVDQAGPFDNITVCEGDYNESIEIPAWGITNLTGEDPTVTIRGNAEHVGAMITSSYGSNGQLNLSNITLSNSLASQSAVWVIYGGLYMEGVTITENGSDSIRPPIYAYGCPYVDINSTTIENNVGAYDASGVWFRDSIATMRDSSITGNITSFDSGNGLAAVAVTDGAQVILENVVIQGNTGIAGVISVTDDGAPSHLTMTNCVVNGNSTSALGNILVSQNSTLVVNGGKISGNTAGKSALYLSDDSEAAINFCDWDTNGNNQSYDITAGGIDYAGYDETMSISCTGSEGCIETTDLDKNAEE